MENIEQYSISNFTKELPQNTTSPTRWSLYLPLALCINHQYPINRDTGYSNVLTQSCTFGRIRIWTPDSGERWLEDVEQSQKMGTVALALLKHFYYKGICIRLPSLNCMYPKCTFTDLGWEGVHNLISRQAKNVVYYPRGFWRPSGEQSITLITGSCSWDIF